MSISLGMPALPPPTLAPRRKTRQIKVGKVLVGGDAPVSVQSMTTTLTSDVNTTLQQIAELTAAGCDIVRVACPSQDGEGPALPHLQLVEPQVLHLGDLESDTLESDHAWERLNDVRYAENDAGGRQ